MIKYMYYWMDWGLFEVKEVEVVEENYNYYKDSKEEYSLVKVKWNSGKIISSIPCPKKYLFDTYEEAYAFGVEECPGGAF